MKGCQAARRALPTLGNVLLLGKLPQTVLGSPGAGAGKAGSGLFQGWMLAHTSEVLGVREKGGSNRRM